MAIAVVPERLVELLQQLALLGRQLDRRFDHDPAEQIPLLASPGRLDALAPQAKYPARLRLRRYFQAHFTVQGRHIDRAAQGRRREGQRDLAAQVRPVSFEDGVLPHPQLDVQVTRLVTVPSALAFVRPAHQSAIDYPTGTLDRALPVLAHTSPSAPALATI